MTAPICMVISTFVLNVSNFLIAVSKFGSSQINLVGSSS